MTGAYRHSGAECPGGMADDQFVAAATQLGAWLAQDIIAAQRFAEWHNKLTAGMESPIDSEDVQHQGGHIAVHGAGLLSKQHGLPNIPGLS